MSKIRYFVLLTMLLSAFIATAQPGPLIADERDWTFHVGSTRYGIYQASWMGGGGYTSVYFGRTVFTVRKPAGLLLALVIVPCGRIGVFLVRREGKTRGITTPPLK